MTNDEDMIAPSQSQEFGAPRIGEIGAFEDLGLNQTVVGCVFRLSVLGSFSLVT